MINDLLTNNLKSYNLKPWQESNDKLLLKSYKKFEKSLDHNPLEKKLKINFKKIRR